MKKGLSLLFAMTLAMNVSVTPVLAKNVSDKPAVSSAQKDEKDNSESVTSSDNSANSSKNAEKSTQETKTQEAKTEETKTQETKTEETKTQELKKVFKDELNEQKKELQQQKTSLNQQQEALEAQYQLMLDAGDTEGAKGVLESINALNKQIDGVQAQIKETINERYMVVKTMYTDEELVQFSNAADLISQMYADAEVLAEGSVTVNNNLIKFDTPAYIKNGVTLVPLRAISEELGGEVSWDEETKTVTITRGDTVVQISSNSTTAIVNGSPVDISLPATENCGRTYVPLRFLAESLGFSTEWDGENEIIEINDGLTDSSDNSTDGNTSESTDESSDTTTPVVSES